MLLGIIGDTHYTNRGPSKRLDDFFATQLLKTSEALSIFQKQGCDHIFQVGDLFDSHSVANRVKAAIILLLKKKHVILNCIAGQHDIVGHSLGTLPNSPLSVLEAAGVIHLLNGICFNDAYTNMNWYGASYGAIVPTPVDPKAYNILVIHAMIGDRELYPGQPLKSPIRFLKQYPEYALILAGDYHYSFEATYQGRTIINPGCLVRKTVSTFDLEHKPSVVIFDTETSNVEWFPLTIEPSEDVFDLTKASIQNTFDVDKFLNSLKRKLNGKRLGEDWEELLLEALDKRKSNEQVKQILDECMEEIRS